MFYLKIIKIFFDDGCRQEDGIYLILNNKAILIDGYDGYNSIATKVYFEVDLTRKALPYKG